MILIVDDQIANRDLLEAFLTPLGYEIMKASDGIEALELVATHKIDLILSDVIMPGMNGFELCKILKSSDAYRPVILITVLEDRESLIRGMESGADDMLTKPIDSLILKTKIKNMLKLKSLYDEVERSNQNLKKLSVLKENLTSFIVHDLRNPLASITIYLELISRSRKIEPEYINDLEVVNQSVKKMIGMISDLLDISKIENSELAITVEPSSLEEIITRSIQDSKPFLLEKSLTLFSNASEFSGGSETVLVQKDLIDRVLQNLFSNAIKYSPDFGSIFLEGERTADGKFFQISVSDSGQGVPVEYQQTIFDKFSTVESKYQRIRTSTGLGLTFCKLVVELHGGRIWVEDSLRGGSNFRFTIPLT